jgi:Na+/phosphate symporter
MNKIFKVIWSKSRNCYVVASELAKGTSKSTSTGRMAKRAALAAVAALLLFPAGIGNSYAENTATVTDTSGTQQTVYTKEGIDNGVTSLQNEIKTVSTQVLTSLQASVEAITEIQQNMTDQKTSLEKADATEAAAREAADTKLDTRITDVKEYLEKQTSDKYVSKDDAAVQDGAVVKAANTIGDNVTKLDAALAKETADRLGADAAQDKVIQQVNDNLVASVNTINESVKTTNENMFRQSRHGRRRDMRRLPLYAGMRQKRRIRRWIPELPRLKLRQPLLPE